MSLKLKFILALLFTSVMFSFAQKNEKKDTLTLLDLYNKIEKIEKTLSKNTESETKIVKTKTEETDLKNENKLIKEDIKLKQTTIDKLTKDVAAATLKLNKYRADSIDLQAKLNTQNIKLQDFEKNERDALQKEINAVLNQGYTFPKELLNSLNNRCNNLAVKPINFESLKKYIEAHSIIYDSFLLIEKPFDNVKNLIAISLLNKLMLEKEVYNGLAQNKIDIESILSKYCTKTNEIAKKIEDINSQTFSEDLKRKETLETKEWMVKNYPYLKSQLNKAVEDKNFRIEKIACQ